MTLKGEAGYRELGVALDSSKPAQSSWYTSDVDLLGVKLQNLILITRAQELQAALALSLTSQLVSKSAWSFG